MCQEKKLKTHRKVIAATWDDDSNESESESQSSDDDRTQGVKAFMSWSTPMTSLTSSLESENDSESEFGKYMMEIFKRLLTNSS